MLTSIIVLSLLAACSVPTGNCIQQNDNGNLVMDLSCTGTGDGGSTDGGTPDGGDDTGATTDGGTLTDGGGSDAGTIDGGTPDGGGADGGTDGGSPDGGSSDGGTTDGGTSDGGADGGTGDDTGTGDGGSDGGTSDGGTGDGGSPDGGSTDGGSDDTGTTDGGSPDGGTTDGGTGDDTGTTDGGVSDGGSDTGIGDGGDTGTDGGGSDDTGTGDGGSDGGTSDGGADTGDTGVIVTDVDGDGYNDVVFGGDDCDDSNPDVNPGATEVCNDIDDDCNGSVDDGVLSSFYWDEDGDGYGNPDITEEACSAPTGYVANDSDCDDGEAQVNPDAIENSWTVWDDNCDGGDAHVGTTYGSGTEEGTSSFGDITFTGENVVPLEDADFRSGYGAWYVSYSYSGYGHPTAATMTGTASPVDGMEFHAMELLVPTVPTSYTYECLAIDLDVDPSTTYGFTFVVENDSSSSNRIYVYVDGSAVEDETVVAGGQILMVGGFTTSSGALTVTYELCSGRFTGYDPKHGYVSQVYVGAATF